MDRSPQENHFFRDSHIAVYHKPIGISFLQYCKNEQDKTLLNTEIAIPPRYWNKKLRRVADTLPPEYLGHEKLNLELNRMHRIAEDIIIHAINKKYADPVRFVKETFSPNYDTSKPETAKLLLKKK